MYYWYEADFMNIGIEALFFHLGNIEHWHPILKETIYRLYIFLKIAFLKTYHNL